MCQGCVSRCFCMCLPDFSERIVLFPQFCYSCGWVVGGGGGGGGGGLSSQSISYCSCVSETVPFRVDLDIAVDWV